MLHLGCTSAAPRLPLGCVSCWRCMAFITLCSTESASRSCSQVAAVKRRCSRPQRRVGGCRLVRHKHLRLPRLGIVTLRRPAPRHVATAASARRSRVAASPVASLAACLAPTSPALAAAARLRLAPFVGDRTERRVGPARSSRSIRYHSTTTAGRGAGGGSSSLPSSRYPWCSVSDAPRQRPREGGAAYLG